MPAAKKCEFCPTILIWIKTETGSWTPCRSGMVMRSEGGVLPEGRYVTVRGENYSETTAPIETPLYRSHWGDCPGAAQARELKKARER